MKDIPVFVINGFLEAGKSQFILSTIRRDGFYQNGKTLIISCEQGEIEYDEIELSKYNTIVRYIDDQKDFTVENLTKIYKEIKPKRIVMEMNFMWDYNKIEFPSFFAISQLITIIDGITFPLYYNNMRQKFTDVIRTSDVVAFTKLNDDRSSLSQFEAGLRMTNSQCLYCLINEECISTMEAFDKVLPYNINDESIEINDNDFGLFYIDTFDQREKYENKIVTFNAWVVKSPKLPDNQFIAGRKVLNCCADDIQLFGFLVIDSLNLKLENDSWIKLTARCNVKFVEDYEEEEIVLTPLNIEIIPAINNPILDLR